jgi:hypothetical protein
VPSRAPQLFAALVDLWHSVIMAMDHEKIELNDEDRAQLARAARQSGKPWRQLLNEVIAAITTVQRASRQLQAEAVSSPSLLDRLLALGAVGIIKDGPSDLSTNRQHMEGFGRSK